MNNADDSPPSDSDHDKNREAGTDEGDDRRATSREDADERGSSETDHADSDSGSSTDHQKRESKGMNLPAPSSVGEDGSAGEGVDEKGAEDPPDETPVESAFGPSSLESESTEEDGSDLFDVDDELILEENAFEEGAFEAARQADRERAPGEEFAADDDQEYDVGPTRVSDGSFDDDFEETSEPFDDSSSHDSDSNKSDGEKREGGESGLESLASEMEEAEAAGELHDEATFEVGDATIDESAFERDDYEKTTVSNPGFEYDDPPDDHRERIDRSEQSRRDSRFSGAHGVLGADAEDGAEGSDASTSNVGQTPGSDRQPSGPSDSARTEGRTNPPPPEESGRGGRADRRSTGGTNASATGREERGEFANQATELFDSPFENDPIYPRLSVLEGPSAGQEYLLKNIRNSVGRSTKNGVVVPDEAMSRQHLEIVENPDESYSIRDLQSVNGTYLNGKRIEEADLFHGDRVKAGQTTLQFVVPGQSPQYDERNRRVVPAGSKKGATKSAQSQTVAATPSAPPRADRDLTVWLNRIIVGASILMIPLAGLFAYLTLYGPARLSTSEQNRIESARTTYLEGVEAVREREWKAARRHFRKALKSDANLPSIEAQLSRIETETQAHSDLQKARTALTKGETDKAITLAESIPKESVYFEEARDLLRRERRKRRLSNQYERAARQFENNENEKALATIQRILSTIPNHDEALALRRKVLATSDVDVEKAKERAKREERKQREKARAETSKDRSGDRATGTSSDSDRKTGSSWLLQDDDSSDEKPEKRAATGAGGMARVNFTKGFALYKNKNYGAAISHFQGAAQEANGMIAKRAENAANQIREFRDAYRAGQRASEKGAYQKAAEQYRKALRADKQVTSEGYFEGELATKIAGAKASRGLELFEDGDHSAAFRAAKDAGHFDRSHPKVRELDRKLETEAKSLYVRAKAKRKTDPGKAASLCRDIMSMRPEDAETYRKAEALLDDI